MAQVVVFAKRIQKAVDLKVTELEAAIVQYREERVQDYMSEDYRVNEGWFWWKTSRLRTREEAERKYDTGYFGEVSGEELWFSCRAKQGEENFKSSIRQAQRLARAAKETDGVYITLSEDEVHFLKLSGDDKV